MAKKQDTYHCTECGWTSVRWVGKCGECQTWGSVVERGAQIRRAIIAEGAVIGAGAAIGEATGNIAVVGPNVTLAAGSSVKAGEQYAG